MNIPRSDLHTAVIVKTVCKLYDETGDMATAMKVLAKYVPQSVSERVLLRPQDRRQM